MRKRVAKKLANPPTEKQALRKRVYSLRSSISRDGSAKLDVLEVENAVLAVLGKSCTYCDQVLNISNVSGDHRISLKNGGASTLDNINFRLCKSCNAGKSEFDELAFKELIQVANKHGITKKLLAKLKYSNFQFKRSYS